MADTPTPAEEVVLAYLHADRKATGSASDIAKTLARWAPKDLLEPAIDRLLARGWVTRGKRLALTDAGRPHAAAIAGSRNWTRIQKRLVGRALKGDAPADASELRARLVAQHTGARGDTLAEQRDVLLWRALGFTEIPRRTLGLADLRALLVHKALHPDASPDVRPPNVEDQLVRLAAEVAGARRTDANELRRAAVARWLSGTDGSPRRNGNAGIQELAGFAKSAVRAAGQSPSGWFGRNKLFVSHAWRSLPEPRVPFDEYKQKLLAAHRAELVELTRADLVEAADPRDVADSEIDYLGAKYHLLRVEERA